MALFEKLSSIVATITVDRISEERKKTLQPLIDFIQEKVNKKETIRLNFICTHNSRRSHFSQIWAQTMAFHFGIRNVHCYSGGTEATALFPMVIKTLQPLGFEIAAISAGNNPIYSIKYAANEPPVIGFSKELDHCFNPQTGFGAVMTCDSANEACPFVVGAEKRMPITFEDPKVFDNTPQQAEKYSERSTQIATEMFYVFSKIQ
jgi:arsenate reductase (thioredoxin)